MNKQENYNNIIIAKEQHLKDVHIYRIAHEKMKERRTKQKKRFYYPLFLILFMALILILCNIFNIGNSLIKSVLDKNINKINVVAAISIVFIKPFLDLNGKLERHKKTISDCKILIRNLENWNITYPSNKPIEMQRLPIHQVQLKLNEMERYDNTIIPLTIEQEAKKELNI